MNEQAGDSEWSSEQMSRDEYGNMQNNFIEASMSLSTVLYKIMYY